MLAVKVILGVGWAGFWVYWLARALTAKRSRIPWSREVAVRLAIVVVVVLLVRLGVFRHRGAHDVPLLAAVGLVLFALGLSLAIWARVTIGRNWGMPMTRKDDPELVTSGPYRLIRHPIYSGILLAGIGTAVALNWIWLIVVALVGCYFTYSALIEERYLSRTFPDAYPGYQRSTKRLVPYLF